MRTSSGSFRFLAMISIVVNFFFAASADAQGARLFIEPMNLDPGATNQEVLIRCDSPNFDLFGYSLALQFDPAVIEVTAVETWDGQASRDPDFALLQGEPQTDPYPQINTLGEINFGVIVTLGDGNFDPAKIIRMGANQVLARLMINVRATGNAQTAIQFNDDLPTFSTAENVLSIFCEDPDPPPDPPCPSGQSIKESRGGDFHLDLQDGQITIGEPQVSPPCAFIASTSGDAIRIDWTHETPDSVGFQVQRRLAGEGDFQTIATLGSGILSHEDTGLPLGESFEYRVIATGPGGNSPPSPPVVDGTKLIEILKAAAKEGKKGQGVKLSKVTYRRGLPTQEEVNNLVVRVGGLPFLTSPSKPPKVKTDKSNPDLVAKYSLKAPDGKLSVDFAKGKLKITLKNVSGLTLSDGAVLMVEVAVGDHTATLEPVLQARGKKFVIGTITAGEFFPLPELNLCNAP